MFIFDPMYLIMVGPAMLLAFWAQWMVKSAFANGKQYPSRSGMTGAQVAQRILEAYNIEHVGIEPAQGFLGDHYDPRRKVLRLSPEVYGGRDLAALGVAAHEVGHAIQDAKGYAPLVLRNGLVPLANVGSQFSTILIIVGLVLMYLSQQIGMAVAIAGVLFFGVVVLFQLINLPVEFDASSRARRILVDMSIISESENRVVGRVLNAAAMTYVAATITALMQLLYFLYIILERRR
ncbi:MAG: zinc metallopeptidase [Phycisphaerae bacterium]